MNQLSLFDMDAEFDDGEAMTPTAVLSVPKKKDKKGKGSASKEKKYDLPLSIHRDSGILILEGTGKISESHILSEAEKMSPELDNRFFSVVDLKGSVHLYKDVKKLAALKDDKKVRQLCIVIFEEIMSEHPETTIEEAVKAFEAQNPDFNGWSYAPYMKGDITYVVPFLPENSKKTDQKDESFFGLPGKKIEFTQTVDESYKAFKERCPWWKERDKVSFNSVNGMFVPVWSWAGTTRAVTAATSSAAKKTPVMVPLPAYVIGSVVSTNTILMPEEFGNRSSITLDEAKHAIINQDPVLAEGCTFTVTKGNPDADSEHVQRNYVIVSKGSGTKGSETIW